MTENRGIGINNTAGVHTLLIPPPLSPTIHDYVGTFSLGTVVQSAFSSCESLSSLIELMMVLIPFEPRCVHLLQLSN
jgi:hypothetical protein